MKASVAHLFSYFNRVPPLIDGRQLTWQLFCSEQQWCCCTRLYTKLAPQVESDDPVSVLKHRSAPQAACPFPQLCLTLKKNKEKKTTSPFLLFRLRARTHSPWQRKQAELHSWQTVSIQDLIRVIDHPHRITKRDSACLLNFSSLENYKLDVIHFPSRRISSLLHQLSQSHAKLWTRVTQRARGIN